MGNLGSNSTCGFALRNSVWIHTIGNLAHVVRASDEHQHHLPVQIPVAPGHPACCCTTQVLVQS